MIYNNKYLSPENYNLKNQTSSKIRNKKSFTQIEQLKYLIKKKNPIILDIGSNYGQSIIKYQKCFPYSLIHCFEPNKKIAHFLIKKFSFNKKIIINNIAVDIKNGSKKFYWSNIHSGLSGFNRINKNSLDSINNLKKIKEIDTSSKVKTITAKSYINKSKIKKIDLVKIDTQGHVDNILKSFFNKLKIIEHIIIEVKFYDLFKKNNSLHAIEIILNKYNFKIYDIIFISKNPKTYRTDWIDVLYKRY
jgi:FkbM family methyltransferase